MWELKWQNVTAVALIAMATSVLFFGARVISERYHTHPVVVQQSNGPLPQDSPCWHILTHACAV